MALDTAYFRHRALQERGAAADCANADARASHEELARRYEDLVAVLEARSPALKSFNR